MAIGILKAGANSQDGTASNGADLVETVNSVYGRSQQTLADAVTFAESGAMAVGGVVSVIDSSAPYQLLDAGSAEARPTARENVVVHVTGGSGGLYLRLTSEFLSPEAFGCTTNGIDCTASFKTWVAHSSSLYISAVKGAKKSYKVTDFDLTLPYQKLFGIGNIEIVTTGTGIVLSGDFASMQGISILAQNAAANGIETTGFANKLIDTTVTGTSTNALMVNGLETHVRGGKYKGGSVAAINANAADCSINSVYVEGSGNGLRSVGAGTVFAYDVHSFGNTNQGFYLSGADGSKLVNLYGDTNGSNNFELRDSKNVDIINPKMLKAGQTAASSVHMQFFNCQKVNVMGGECRIDGAAGTSNSHRFSGTDNQINFIGHDAEKAPDGASTNPLVKFLGCKGALTKYSTGLDSTVISIGNIAPASTYNLSVPINTDDNVLVDGTGFKSFDVEIAYRSTSSNIIGTCHYTVMVTAISGATKVFNRYPTSPIITLSNPAIGAITNKVGTFTLDVYNTYVSTTLQVGIKITESITSRGIN